MLEGIDILTAILKNEPVLLAPNFAKEFKLAVDASDTSAGSVLIQEDCIGVDHPVSYFSKTFNKHQKNYSYYVTISPLVLWGWEVGAGAGDEMRIWTASVP